MAPIYYHSWKSPKYLSTLARDDARLDASFNCPDGAKKHADELSGTGETGENAPNEANLAESMSIVEAQDPIQVTASSGARSRLDKRGGAAWHVENHRNWGNFAVGPSVGCLNSSYT